MQSLLPKTRRSIAIALTCAASLILLLDAFLFWLPVHPRLVVVARALALLGTVSAAVLFGTVERRLRRLLHLAANARRNERFFLAASESSFDSFFVLESVRDAQGEIVDFRFVYVNRTGAKLISSTPEELAGKLLCESYPINRSGGFFDTYKRVVETGERVRAEFPIDALGIQATWLSHQVVKLEDGIAITASDITDAKQKELMLQYLAHHDSLTGLARRSLFNERLEEALRNAGQSRCHAALLVVDCDHFKRVNDQLGHPVGDHLLTQMASRLQANVRKSDTVARMGGDEFLVVLGDLGHEQQAAAIAQQLLQALQTPIQFDGRKLSLTASIGVAVYPQDGGDAVELLKNADASVYRAKADGRNRVQMFTPEMAASVARRRAVEAALQHALAREEFALAYQPRVDLATGQVNGVEALLRWHSAELGAVSPGEFISIAEENGLIVPIGRWVMETACREMRSLYPVGGRRMVLAVNVSPVQFQQETLAQDIASALGRHRLDAGCLEVEITEGLLLQESPQSRRTFDTLRDLGVSIAIDDFGTGYSSMSYLMRFRVEHLKIDQTFVRRMNFDAESNAICKALVCLGKALNIAVVAEGVESEEHRDMLWALGCEEAQGYLFSRPVPIGELAEAVKRIERSGVPALVAA